LDVYSKYSTARKYDIPPTMQAVIAKGKGFGNLRSWEILFCPLFMVNLGKEKFKGVIPHFYAAGLVISIGKHGLKIIPEFFNVCLFRIFSAEFCIILDMPPVTFTGACT